MLLLSCCYCHCCNCCHCCHCCRSAAVVAVAPFFADRRCWSEFYRRQQPILRASHIPAHISVRDFGVWTRLGRRRPVSCERADHGRGRHDATHAEAIPGADADVRAGAEHARAARERVHLRRLFAAAGRQAEFFEAPAVEAEEGSKPQRSKCSRRIRRSSRPRDIACRLW